MPTPDAVSTRLRQIRQQRNLTLKQVEISSHGKWKAVVVGSYERGTRSLSIHRATELCSFYGVPLLALFKESIPSCINEEIVELIFDLRRVKVALRSSDSFVEQTSQLLQWIAQRRDDWNGEVLTIRNSDFDTLAMLTNRNSNDLKNALKIRDLVLKN